MKPALRFPTALHVMAVAILASSFVGSMAELSAEDWMTSVDRTSESPEATTGLADVEYTVA